MTRKNRLRAKVQPYAYHLKAVADVQRLSIVYLLANGPLELREIIDATGLHPSLVAHHIKKLEQFHWVTRIPSKRFLTYEMNPKALLELSKLFKGTEVGKKIEAIYSPTSYPSSNGRG